MNNIPQMLAILLFGLLLTSCSQQEELILDTSTVDVEVLTENQIESEIINLVNTHRAQKGLPDLQRLDVIKTQTQEHTQYMIDKGIASHDNFFKRKHFLTQKANAEKVSENVGHGYSSAKKIVEAWIKSENHRLNIEGDFNYFNVTAAKDTNGKWYFTNIFIYR